MKIDELKRIAEANDYICWSTNGDFYEFKRRMTFKLIKIGKLELGRIYFHNFDICDEKDFTMIDACMVLSYTPPEDREEEKKFYLKHRWIKGCVIMYLYRNELNGYCYLGDKKCRPHRQKRFTLKEIEEIKKKFDTDLKDFELVEVEDD